MHACMQDPGLDALLDVNLINSTCCKFQVDQDGQTLLPTSVGQWRLAPPFAAKLGLIHHQGTGRGKGAEDVLSLPCMFWGPDGAWPVVANLEVDQLRWALNTVQSWHRNTRKWSDWDRSKKLMNAQDSHCWEVITSVSNSSSFLLSFNSLLVIPNMSGKVAKDGISDFQLSFLFWTHIPWWWSMPVFTSVSISCRKQPCFSAPSILSPSTLERGQKLFFSTLFFPSTYLMSW
jgi:hypothetical protein